MLASVRCEYHGRLVGARASRGGRKRHYDASSRGATVPLAALPVDPTSMDRIRRRRSAALNQRSPRRSRSLGPRAVHGSLIMSSAIRSRIAMSRADSSVSRDIAAAAVHGRRKRRRQGAPVRLAVRESRQHVGHRLPANAPRPVASRTHRPERPRCRTRVDGAAARRSGLIIPQCQCPPGGFTASRHRDVWSASWTSRGPGCAGRSADTMSGQQFFANPNRAP